MMKKKTEANNQRLREIEKALQQLEYEEHKRYKEIEQLLIEDTYESAEKSFWDFYVAAWSVMEPNTKFMGNWHMEMICDHLQAMFEGEIQNLIISTPPRCSKSSIVNVAFPAWVWINEPWAEFLCGCYGDELAIRDSQATRALILSDWYQARWKDRYQLSPDNNRLNNFKNTQGGRRIATSRGGKGTGWGYRYLLIDDPMKPKEITSKKAIQEVNDWWDLTLSSRGTSEDSRVAIFHQRYCENDLTGHVLEQDLGFVHIDLPMLYEKDRPFYSPLGWTDPRTEEGEVLWKERFPDHVIETYKKKLGTYGFAAQYQQNPVPRGGGIIKKDWIKYYNSLPDRFNWILSSWDLTFGETGNSYYVGVVIGVLGANKYVIDEYRGKGDFIEQIAQIRQSKKDYPQIRTVLIEKKAGGEPAIAVLKNEMPGIVEIKPTSSKEIRLSACSPDFESGNIYYPAPSLSSASWSVGHIEELTTFPRAANDDRADAISQALNHIAEKGGGTQGITIWYEPKKVMGVDYTWEDIEKQKLGDKMKSISPFHDETVICRSNLKSIFNDK